MAGFSIFVSLLFIVIATGILVFGCLASVFSWLSAALIILLYTKGVRSMMIGLRIRASSQSLRIFSAKDFRVIAAGYLLAAGLSLVSWLAGEGLLGLFAAIGTSVVSAALLFAAKRVEAI